MRVSHSSTSDSGVVGTMREGVLAQKFLLTGQDGSPSNYVLNVGRAGEGGWQAPRHRHNFDQIRYVIKGNYPLGKGKSLPEGWVGYFPESVPYGPQDRPEGLETMVLQFGGASGNGFLSIAQREAANDALKKKGEFKNGIFTYYDDKGNRHNKDGSVACFEEATGRALTFAKPRYDDIVLMNPSACEWIAQPGARGVYRKWLGSFTERNARVGLIRLDADALFSAGVEPAIQILFLAKGRIEVGGRECGAETAIEFSASEAPAPIKAIDASEFVCMILPQF